MDEMGKQTVLIIDDSIFVCRQIKMILEGESLNLREAHSGQEAIAEMGQCCPDLILLDIVLPDIEGYELFDRIKLMDKNNAAIIFITSKDGDGDVVKGFSKGACDYIKKPFGKEELRSRIIAHLNAKKQRDEVERLNRELQMSMEKLNYMAFRDRLTGLYNRHYVEDDLLNELKGKNMTGSWEDMENVIIMADVDDFKKVNDQYGHETGDMVLVGISNIMESVCKRHKVVRWGGEEFVMILFTVSRNDAFALGEKIRKQVEELPFFFENTTFHCTVTLGLSVYDKSVDMKENIDRADRALYDGKRSGKNRSVWYTGETGE